MRARRVGHICNNQNKVLRFNTVFEEGRRGRPAHALNIIQKRPNTVVVHLFPIEIEKLIYMILFFVTVRQKQNVTGRHMDIKAYKYRQLRP